jgi:orotidine-5'-phosphate decarboxylase
MDHFADRLHEAMARKGAPVCVGIDPVFERLPDELAGNVEPSDRQQAIAAIGRFVDRVIEAVAEQVPVVKFQSACFERYGWAGVQCLEQAIANARQAGLLVILDAKRGDIGSSAAHYAAGNLIDGPDGPDALTINSYLGDDSLQPFMEVASRQGKGLFALVRTSNPGGDALQRRRLDDGRTVCDAVAAMVQSVGRASVGACGYSLLGAVVGATKPADMAGLRQRMPQQIFLVPGFGAQGGTAEDVKACFNADGRGALITASRSITYAHDPANPGRWQQAITNAAIDMKQQINAAV